MALTMKQILKRHGAVVAAVAAASVATAILVQQILESLVNWISYFPIAAAQGHPYALGDVIPEALVVALSFGVGFFLSLWIVAPIAEELRLPHVVTRAVLATGIGATVYFIVRAILGLVGAFGGGGPWFGNSLVWPTFDGGYAVSQLSAAFSGSILLLIAVLPLGILAGVLLWLWRKDHPPKRPLSGLIDEV